MGGQGNGGGRPRRRRWEVKENAVGGAGEGSGRSRKRQWEVKEKAVGGSRKRQWEVNEKAVEGAKKPVERHLDHRLRKLASDHAEECGAHDGEGRGHQPSRWRVCHFADIPSPSLLKRLLKGEGGSAE